ncbi:MAG: hypothetical protein AB8I08_05610 [Sandaracinaceae bacterium]
MVTPALLLSILLGGIGWFAIDRYVDLWLLRNDPETGALNLWAGGPTRSFVSPYGRLLEIFVDTWLSTSRKVSRYQALTQRRAWLQGAALVCQLAVALGLAGGAIALVGPGLVEEFTR